MERLRFRSTAGQDPESRRTLESIIKTNDRWDEVLTLDRKALVHIAGTPVGSRARRRTSSVRSTFRGIENNRFHVKGEPFRLKGVYWQSLIRSQYGD
ncbi:MAG: hypothetical protein ACE5NJ_02935 [Thermodesulfobacteriota bacterium]